MMVVKKLKYYKCGETEIIIIKLKTINKMEKIKSGKFAKTREGFGILGMTLNLNLAQCQALNYHLNEIKYRIANR